MTDYQVKQLEQTIADLKEELAMFKERCLQQERLITELQKRPFVMPSQPFGPMTPIPCGEPVDWTKQVKTYGTGCSVCGMGKNGEVMGYACPRLDCPTGSRCLT